MSSPEVFARSNDFSQYFLFNSQAPDLPYAAVGHVSVYQDRVTDANPKR